MPVLQIQKVSLQPRGSGPLQAALQARMSRPAFSTWAQVPSELCNSKVGDSQGRGRKWRLASALLRGAAKTPAL